MTTHTPLSPKLASHLRALDEQQPDTDRVDAAQQRLVARVADRHPRKRLTRGIAWIGAASAAMLVLALTLAPVLTGHGDAQAFTAVQQKLQNFRTLHMTLTQRANGIALPTIRTWATRDGNMRTDIGGSTSVIINVRQHTMLTLLHAQHMAMRQPLDARADTSTHKVMGWLDTIRRFKGKARSLPGTRRIDGHVTHGWTLDASGMHVEIWADDDNVPRAVDISGGMHMHQHLNLVLDQPIDPTRFQTSLPPGYRWAQHD